MGLEAMNETFNERYIEFHDAFSKTHIQDFTQVFFIPFSSF